MFPSATSASLDRCGGGVRLLLCLALACALSSVPSSRGGELTPEDPEDSLSPLRAEADEATLLAALTNSSFAYQARAVRALEIADGRHLEAVILVALRSQGQETLRQRSLLALAGLAPARQRLILADLLEDCAYWVRGPGQGQEFEFYRGLAELLERGFGLRLDPEEDLGQAKQGYRRRVQVVQALRGL